MLPDKIRSLRKQHGYSQIELAKLMDVSQPTITSWETGRADPSSSAIKQLANIFSVSTDYLLGMKKTDTPKQVELSPVTDKNAIFTYEGKRIPEKDLEIIKRILETGEYGKSK